jgi:hypothetical protein
MHKRTALVATLSAAALVLTGCAGGGGDTESPAGPGGDTDALFEVATDVELEGSPTYDSMVEAGKVTIGAKVDQPNLGYLEGGDGRARPASTSRSRKLDRRPSSASVRTRSSGSSRSPAPTVSRQS